MADTQNALFNQKAVDRLRSPDDLDKYVHVTNPSVWMLLVACIAMLVGILAWAIFGAVTTNVSATGACINGQALCFLSADDVAKVKVGNTASVGGRQMTVAQISKVPLSREEATAELERDYLAATLMKEDWAYEVRFSGDSSTLEEGVPLAVSITVERVAPITLVTGRSS